MFTQISHQIPSHMPTQIPHSFQGPQASQNQLMYPKQMFPPQAPSHFQIQTHFIETEQQIQQEISQLQQLQLQIQLRKQQLFSSINTPQIPIQPYHQSAVHPMMPQYSNQNLNPQNGYNIRKGLPMMEQEEFNRIPLQMKQDIPMKFNNYNLNPQAFNMYMNDHTHQQQLNRKRPFDNNFQYSKIEDHSDSPTHENIVLKKICTEEIKSATSFIEQSMIHQKINGYQNMNLMYGQQPFPQKGIQSSISDCSSTLSIRNNQPSMNNFGLELNTNSNQCPQQNQSKNFLMIKREAQNELNGQHKENQQDQYSSDNQNSDKRCKKEIQNDSNYTKNLLKGFRRHMNKKYKDNKDTIEKFQQYFYNNTLSNEFILTLLENSSYQSEFEEFLQADPSWWIKEAKIKEPTRQLKFFETVKSKNYADIRTKRKGKQTNNTDVPAKNTNSNNSAGSSEEQNQQIENIIQKDQQNSNPQSSNESDNTTNSQ